MWKRWTIVGLLVAAVLGGVWGVRAWRAARKAAAMAIYLENRDAADPNQRLSALEGLLREDPDQPDVRFERAQTLLELGWHQQARGSLHLLLDSLTDSPQQSDIAPRQVARILIDSYLTEANGLVSRADRREVESALDRVETMMAQVAKLAPHLTTQKDDAAIRLTEARRLDALCRVYRFCYENKRADLAQAQAIGAAVGIEKAGVELADLERRVKELEDALAIAVEAVLEKDPHSTAVVELNFLQTLRSNNVAGARHAAAWLAAQEKLPADLAGRVAGGLLDMEVDRGEVVTDLDIELAGKLLLHSGLTGKPTIENAVAHINYHLQRGDPVEAEKLARQWLQREPLHVRLRCMAALARVQQGDPRKALDMLVQYQQKERSAAARYALGTAYLANDQLPQSKDAFRDCLELDPHHLLARVRLVDVLVRQKMLVQAADDIRIAEQINPHHPRVLALKAKLAMATGDPGMVVQLLDQPVRLNQPAPGAAEAAMTAAMVLDDVARLKRWAFEPAGTPQPTAYRLVAQAWTEADAKMRGRMSPAVARTLLNYLRRDPLLLPEPPAAPVRGALAAAARRGSLRNVEELLEPLGANHFVTLPHEEALACAEEAMDTHGFDPRLATLAAELNLWLDRPAQAKAWLAKLKPGTAEADEPLVAAMRSFVAGDPMPAELLAKPPMGPTWRLMRLSDALARNETDAIVAEMTGMMQAHPWAEAALWRVAAQAVRRRQPDLAYARLAMAQQLHVQAAQLARARLHLVMGRPADALLEAEAAVRDEEVFSEVRRMAAELRARAHLMLDQQSLAVGVFDQLASSVREHRPQARLGAADVLIAMDKPFAASQVLSELASVPQTPDRMLDQILARAWQVMEPARMRALVDAMLNFRPDDPLLLLYQAKLAGLEDSAVAERMMKNVLARRAGAPRAVMELADLLRPVQADESRRLLDELIQRGGRVAEAAQRQRDGVRPQPAKADEPQGLLP